MKAILSTVVASLVLSVSALKIADFQNLNFAGGKSCNTCQDITNGGNCCDEGSKPTVGQGCNGASGGTESDCNGAVGRACFDSGEEQEKVCDSSATEDCIKGFAYTCVNSVWEKGEQNVSCGTKNLCSMENP